MRRIHLIRLALSPRRQRLLAAVQRGARRRMLETVSSMMNGGHKVSTHQPEADGR